jgi:hypothetical protein
MKKTLFKLMLLILGFSSLSNAQMLDSQNKIAVALDDGTQVVMYGRAKSLDNGFTGEYYYLPTNLRLSKRDDGTPEFLFLKYTTEQRADAGGVQGALMHFLMEWGLSDAQMKEAETKLIAKVKSLANSSGPFKQVTNPKLLGPASLRSDTPESFRIISAVLGDKGFTPNIVTSGRAPLLPGSKIAVASRLEKNGAQLLAATFEKTRSISDVSLDLRFRFDVLTPAVNGYIKVNYKKMDELIQKYKRDYSHKDVDDGTMPWWNSLQDDIITDVERDSLYTHLKEDKAVDIKIDNLKPDDPNSQKIMATFMDYFMASISDKQMASPAAVPTSPADGRYNPPIDLYEYHLDKTKYEKKIVEKEEIYKLNFRIPVTEDITITENLASWYDGVKDNPKCISSVNLNDPFFQHRDINFILDLEAEEMFGKEVNFVTVNVRKKRNSGNAFSDRVTIDRDYLKKKGVKATMTYARGEDNNPDTYEYQSQWSLKGGNSFPTDAPWVKGQWDGVNLAPPVTPRTIEFEANPEELKADKIVRTTLQLRYMKFGKETETNIPISVATGNPLAKDVIFLDRDTKGYAYRLLFDHRDKGKLAMDWKAETSDYVYAVIPEELRDVTSEIFNKALEAGKTILKPESIGGQILDKFKDVLGIIRK